MSACVPPLASGLDFFQVFFWEMCLLVRDQKLHHLLEHAAWSCDSNFNALAVSYRAGILFVNPADLGWNPPVSSWIDQREVQSERANLTILFDKYVPPILESLKTRSVV